LEAGAIVVSDFAADRAFTSTSSRYDATTLALLSVNQEASCCGNRWTAALTRAADGSFDADVSRMVPVPGQAMLVEKHDRVHIPPTGRITIVSAMALVPWVYHQLNPTAVETLLLPGSQTDAIDSQTSIIAQADDEDRPPAVPARDRALRLAPKRGSTTVLWYDPCTFVVDALKRGTWVMIRSGLIK
jgi:hypothetical protein